MNDHAPFQPADLADLDELLLDCALSVTAMRDVHAGVRHPRVIGLRHDVDNVIEPAVEFARWEQERGYRSTYYILHTAPYWKDKPLLRRSLEFIAECGHEIGIHNNALAESLATGRDARFVLAEAIQELRGYGFEISSTVAHGDQMCRDSNGKVRFVNDEMFRECCRPELGVPDRVVGGSRLGQSSLSDFGLDFDANWIGRGNYLSDSGGVWSQPFEDVASGFPFDGQLHMLVHPDWWGDAFARSELVA